jgi:sigma-B regulation protein RsbU (phosphoserine phosphatase)
MKTKRISKKDWNEVLGVHRLFKRINESVISNYGTTTPIEVVDLIISDPYGTFCDGVVTIYPNAESPKEYFLRMHHVDGKTVYNTDLHSMQKGQGGFLKYASTLTEPAIYSNIEKDITDGDLNILPWLARMRTALVVPTMSVTGAPATTVLLAAEEDAFDIGAIKSNLFLTYATTNIILNLLLRIETDKAREALDEELASVGRIQHELLPKQVPYTKGFEWAVYYSTSTHAGGDYYDFFPLSKGQIGVIIADVSGHGSPAAIVMAITRLLLHTYPSEIKPPAAVFRNLNKLLVGNLLMGQFVTAFYFILNQEKKTLTYSNAGHCHPQLFRANNHRVEKLTMKSGLPLGITHNGGFEDASISLEKGDALVFYTDGLREAMNNSKEQYGEDRLQGVLCASSMKHAEEIKDTILDDVHDFCNGAPLRDDLTIIVLKVTE